MRVDALDYAYDEELVAQVPLPERDGARLLVLPERDVGVLHRTIRDLAGLVPPSLWVVNNTKVRSARLLGQKAESGGKAELFLLRRLRADTDPDGETWLALGRASKSLRAGVELVFGSDSALHARVLERREDGTLLVRLLARDVGRAIASLGRVPLPPYIRRAPTPADSERYQTIFAAQEGAVAAPTAGLHLSETLVAQLREAGHQLEAVTLHVGLGTFGPVTKTDLDEHPMHEEEYCVSERTAAAVEEAHASGRRVVAVGTTVVRALESAALEARAAGRSGRLATGDAATRLLIQPGFTFRVVDALLTNFHQPRSTLLALVMAFAGIDRIQNAYREAVNARYRLFSYGDAMLIQSGKGATNDS